MSTKITIEITVAEDQAYTAREAAIIASLQAHPSQGAAAVVKEAPKAAEPKAAPAPAAAPATHAKPPVAKPAPKAAPAPASATSGKAAVLDTTLDEAPAAAEEAEEDLLGGGAEEATYTLEDAVSKATKLVSGGKASEVKAALAAAGAKRVSELKGDAIGTFMQALEA